MIMNGTFENPFITECGDGEMWGQGLGLGLGLGLCGWQPLLGFVVAMAATTLLARGHPIGADAGHLCAVVLGVPQVSEVFRWVEL